MNNTGIGLLGTGQYSQVLGSSSTGIGGYFCCSDTQYNTNQTAVSTVHIPVNDYLVPLVTCTLTDAIVCLDSGHHADMLLFIKHNHCHRHVSFGSFRGRSYSIH